MGKGDNGQIDDDLAQLEAIVARLKTGLVRRDALRIGADRDATSFASYAQSILDSRTQLHRFLPGRYFNDPAFDMLLDLFIATEIHQARSFKVTALASRVPPATAARYVEMMVRDGIIVREADQKDGCRILLSLSGSAMEALRNWLSSISPIPLWREQRE